MRKQSFFWRYWFYWLLDCGLIKKVYKVNKPAVSLKAYMDFSAFKLFLLDVGLLGALSELDAGSIMLDYVEQDYLTNIPLYAVCYI